jgi:2-hydroxy-6-oxonona-2,4-dienedioate hydrolase
LRCSTRPGRQAGADGRRHRRPEPVRADAHRGIKLLQALYREPTIDNLKKMMAVFVFDTSSLTEALYQARLDNMMARQDHLENFVKSLAANPKQFPDYGPRLGEIAAPTW